MNLVRYTPAPPPEEVVEAQTANSDSGPGGPGSVIAETSGGLTINLIFDAAAMAGPVSFRNDIQQAAAWPFIASTVQARGS